MLIYKNVKKLVASIMAVVCTVMLFNGVVVADDVANDSESNVSDGGKVEATADYPVGPEIYGEAAILMDMDTGAILYEKNSYDVMYPASITKIMTALVTLENTSLQDIVTYTNEAIDTLPYDASRYGVVPGENVSINESLYMLMLRSANEVAIGLAIHVAGSEAEFGKLMTERAKEAGALNTNFVNASGLHDDNHYTTAYDMAMITKAALHNSTFAEVWGTPTYWIKPTNIVPTENQIWHTHNMLVNTRIDYYSYAKGGKTGYTDQAGRCLVTYASKDGMNLICVVLKSDSDHVCDDTRSLFEYGFNNFKKVSAATDETRFGQSEESYFIANDELFQYSGKLLEFSNDYITIPASASLSEMGYYIDYDSASEDDTIAVIRYYNGDYFLGKATLKLNTQTDKEVELAPDKENETEEYVIEEELTIDIRWIIGGVATFVILVIIFIVLRKTKDKRKVKKERKKMFKESGWRK